MEDSASRRAEDTENETPAERTTQLRLPAGIEETTQLRLPPGAERPAEKTTQLRVPSRAEIEARSGAEDPAQRPDRGTASGHRGTRRKPAMPSALAGRWARIARRL
ncbi:hypothetical protein ABT086_20810, partial [Streptomyces mirabilis]